MAGPAIVVGRYLDLLAWTPLAGALLGELAFLPRPQRNLLWILLNTDATSVCPERDATIAELTAMLERPSPPTRGIPEPTDSSAT